MVCKEMGKPIKGVTGSYQGVSNPRNINQVRMQQKNVRTQRQISQYQFTIVFNQPITSKDDFNPSRFSQICSNTSPTEKKANVQV